MKRELTGWVWLTGLLMLLMCFAGEATAVTCTSNASGDWKDNVWTLADPCNNGSSGPPVGSTVIIASGTNIKVDAPTLAVANVTINAGGTLRGNPGDTLSLSGNFTNNGTFTANSGTVAFIGTAQTITGNVTFANVTVGASTVLTLAGNVTITGTVTGTIVLANTCPTDYTLTAGAVVMHSCQTSLAAPIAEYRFDEGSAGSVTDSSGNNLSGTLNGGVTVGGSGKLCTGYNFNGSNAFVSVPNTALLNPNQITVAAWVRHNTATIKTWETILAKGDTAYRLHLLGQACSLNNKNTLGALTFGVNGGCAGADVSSGIKPVAGTWYHVVGTYDGTTIKIYVNDGTTLTTASAAYASSLGSNTYPLYIGENAQQTGRYWSGDIDEVKIYGVALTAAQIAAGYANENAGKNWDGTARVCLISAPHHLEIQHASGTGLTCAASTLSIKACGDAACTTAYTGGVSGTLSATGAGMTVNWDGTTGGATGAGFVIPSGSSSVTKNVQVATAGSVVFGIASPTPAPTNASTCNFGSPSCTFTANTAGFIYSNSATGSSYTIPPQVSGIAATGLYLRAVQASTTNPAVCTPAIISSTTSVNMGYACNNPTTCQAGNLATITNITTSTATAIAPGGTSVSLNFDANGSAPITARYDDVGQITLNANAPVTPFGSATAVTLNGSSSFVVAPHHFGISGVTAAPIKAGNNFSAIVTAYNGLATATKNFGMETTPEGVTVSFNKCQPTGAGSSNGTFSGSVGSFNNGAASANNLNWSEVGSGDLVATLTSGSYLSSLLTATGNTGTGGTVCSAGAGNVGRFIPDHFDTAIINGCSGCGFTYSGQPFTVSVTAKNGLSSPSTTVNYDGTASTSPNFARAVTLSAWDAATGATQNPGGSLLPPSNTAVALTAFSQGVASLNSAATMPFYTFTTVPTVPTLIRVRAVDTDNVTSLRVPLSSSTEGQSEIRSGRIKVFNVYGSELLQLPIAVTAQYWKDATSGWVTSSTDSSSSFVVATPPATSAVNFGNYQKNLTAVSIVGSPKTVLLSSGVGGFILSAPGFGKNGSVDMSIPALTGANCYVVPTPLGCYLPSNTARATFGIYKSPLIYRRENY